MIMATDVPVEFPVVPSGFRLTPTPWPSDTDVCLEGVRDP